MLITSEPNSEQLFSGSLTLKLALMPHEVLNISQCYETSHNSVQRIYVSGNTYLNSSGLWKTVYFGQM